MAGETYYTNVAVPGDAATGEWTSWTPVLTAITSNPTLGTGSTATGRYLQINKTVQAEFTIGFGSSGVGAGSGFYQISLPVTAKGTVGGEGLGWGWLWDVSATKMTPCFWRLVLTGPFNKAIAYVDATTNYQASNTIPHAWAAGDYLQGVFNYEAA